MTLTDRILQHILHHQGDFNALALAVFEHQYTHCKPYQHYCQPCEKTPDTIQHWHEIPAVSTDVFRFFDISTQPLGDARYIFQTSGTTQKIPPFVKGGARGILGRHYYHDMQLYDAAIQMSFMRGLAMTGKNTFRVLTPTFHDVPTSSLFYMFQQVLRWYGDAHSQHYCTPDYVVDCEKLHADLLEDIHQQRPVVLLGTAFSLLNFCDYLTINNITLQLPPNSRLLETGGLKGRAREISREALYDLFKTPLGLPLDHCFSEYGMTELSSQCYSEPNSAIFSSPHWMPVRIIHPETNNDVAIGETGLIQFFDLANETAISAIITSDLAIKLADNRFQLIGRSPKAVLRGCSMAFE